MEERKEKDMSDVKEIKVRITERQASAICYGLRQEVHVQPKMHDRLDGVIYQKPFSELKKGEDVKYKRVWVMDQAAYRTLRSAAEEFYEGGNSPGEYRMLDDAELFVAGMPRLEEYPKHGDEV